MLPLTHRAWAPPLGPKFARSVPLRLGADASWRTSTAFVSVGYGATTRLVLSYAAGCVVWSLRSPLASWYAPTGLEDEGVSSLSAGLGTGRLRGGITDFLAAAKGRGSIHCTPVRCDGDGVGVH